MNKVYTIFYSWQSSVGKVDNRTYIRDAIDKFKNQSKFDLILDEATKYRAGSPDIPSTVLEKIGLADVFICDLTIVTKDINGKTGMPNSNVMFELGAAVSLLGWERIICVVNTFYGEPNLLPFDINHHRILCYNKNGNDVKRKLDFTEPLGNILSDYNRIVERFNNNEWRRHDKELFEKFTKLCPEFDLVNSLRNCISRCKFDGYDDKLWNTVIGFQDYPENLFISQELNDSFRQLAKVTDQMQSDFYLLFKFDDEGFETEEPDIEYTQEEKERILHTHVYKLQDPFYPRIESDENIRGYYQKIDENRITINRACNSVIEHYSKFRMCVKRILVV